MSLIRQFVVRVLHLDKNLDQLVANYGPWVYAIIFLIVFAETGLVVTPFLPGDSLLFAIGALGARPDGSESPGRNGVTTRPGSANTDRKSTRLNSSHLGISY